MLEEGLLPVTVPLIRPEYPGTPMVVSVRATPKGLVQPEPVSYWMVKDEPTAITCRLKKVRSGMLRAARVCWINVGVPPTTR